MDVKTPCQPLAYRPDIDGLRAFAVLSVVAYHAFPEWVKGGFIGVDVFFVISGYLIGGIILRDLEQGTFSFRDFYSRRIRRIFPALIVVLASALAFGWFALLPDEFKSLGKHVLGGSTFVSNFVLWQEAGYFDVEAKAKPLLHLWSLGIEEQFYIFFPLLLWFCHRKRIKIGGCIIILSVCSFFYNISLHDAERTADFYSPLTRIWELLAGTLCMFITRNKYITQSNRKIYDLNLAFALLGSLLLLAALCLITDKIPYPGWMALLPVAGTVCLICTGSHNAVSAYILSNNLSVFIGKISYPLYLWHWIFISFFYIITGNSDGKTLKARLWIVAFSFLFAALTYSFVEKPIRFNARRRRQKHTALILAMILLGCLGGIAYATKGNHCRLKGLKNEYVDAIDNRYRDAKKLCMRTCRELNNLGTDMCAQSKEKGRNAIALIGDSHAAHLFPGLMAKQDAGVITFYSGCAPPYIGLTSDPATSAGSKGTELIRYGFDYILNDDAVDTVILSYNPACSILTIADAEDSGVQDRDTVMENGMRRTFDALRKHNKKIIAVLDNPVIPFNLSKCIDRNFPFISSGNTCKFEKKFHDQNIGLYWYRHMLHKISKDYDGIKILDLTDMFCDEAYCYLSKNGKLLYSDDNHLSIDGSLYVADALLQLINE